MFFLKDYQTTRLLVLITLLLRGIIFSPIFSWKFNRAIWYAVCVVDSKKEDVITFKHFKSWRWVTCSYWNDLVSSTGFRHLTYKIQALIQFFLSSLQFIQSPFCDCAAHNQKMYVHQENMVISDSASDIFSWILPHNNIFL